MAIKDQIVKLYESLNPVDIEAFAALLADDCVVAMNGMHTMSGIYEGKDMILGHFMPRVGKSLPDGAGGTIQKILVEGNEAFVHLILEAPDLCMSVGHYFVFDGDLVKEYHIFDDSQKWARTIKPM